MISNSEICGKERLRSVVVAVTLLLLIISECGLIGGYTAIYKLFLQHVSNNGQAKSCSSIPLKRPDIYYVACPQEFSVVSKNNRVIWNRQEMIQTLNFLQNCTVAQTCHEKLSKIRSDNYCELTIKGPGMRLCFDKFTGLVGAVVNSVIHLQYEDLMLLYQQLLYY